MRKLALSLILSLGLLTLPSAVWSLDLTIASETISYSGVDYYGYDEYDYVSEVVFENGFIPDGETGTWGHTLDPNFMFIPDDFTVERAVLQIFGGPAHGSGDGIVTVDEFQETYFWTKQDGWKLVTWYGGDIYDLTYIDDHFWNASPLLINYTPPDHVGVDLYSSTLWVDYSPADGSSAVPEPATMVLFGIGLAGSGIARLRRRK